MAVITATPDASADRHVRVRYDAIST